MTPDKPCNDNTCEQSYNEWLTSKKTFIEKNKAKLYVVETMSCPACKHKWLLPEKEYKNGFRKCPKCGFEK